MNMLEICKKVANLASTKAPDDLFNGNSQNDSIFLSVAQSALEGLLRYGDWQELTKDAVLRTVGHKTTYLINTIVPDFHQILNNTVYIKDSQERVIGAITPEQWQREKFFNSPSADVKFKIQNNCIKFLAPPPDGVKIVFQYRSNNVVVDPTNGYEEKNTFSKNTDIPIFDEYLVKLAIHWRWLARNEMAYDEQFNEYQTEVKKRFGSGRATKDINLAGGLLDPTASTGVIVYGNSGCKSC